MKKTGDNSLQLQSYYRQIGLIIQEHAWPNRQYSYHVKLGPFRHLLGVLAWPRKGPAVKSTPCQQYWKLRPIAYPGRPELALETAPLNQDVQRRANRGQRGVSDGLQGRPLDEVPRRDQSDLPETTDD